MECDSCRTSRESRTAVAPAHSSVWSPVSHIWRERGSYERICLVCRPGERSGQTGRLITDQCGRFGNSCTNQTSCLGLLGRLPASKTDGWFEPKIHLELSHSLSKEFCRVCGKRLRSLYGITKRQTFYLCDERRHQCEALRVGTVITESLIAPYSKNKVIKLCCTSIYFLTILL